MSFVLKTRSHYLGTTLEGEIMFGSLSNGIKPLVFESSEEAWECLKFVYPEKRIGFDHDTDRTYEVDGDNVKFLAALDLIDIIN